MAKRVIMMKKMNHLKTLMQKYKIQNHNIKNKKFE